MSTKTFHPNKTTVISHRSDDYKNIKVIKDVKVEGCNTHAVVYDTGTEYTKAVIKLDTEQPFRTLSGVDPRPFDKKKNKYIDGESLYAWSTAICIYNSEEPTEDESKVYKFLNELGEHIIGEYARALKEDGDNKSKEIGKLLIPHEDIVRDMFKPLVTPATEKNGKKYSPTFTMKHPFMYGDDKEKAMKLKPDDKKVFRKLIPGKYTNSYGEIIDLSLLSPESLKSNSKLLYVRPFFIPDRITFGNGKLNIKCTVDKFLCYFRSFTGTNSAATERDFKYAKPFDESEAVEVDSEVDDNQIQYNSD